MTRVRGVALRTARIVLSAIALAVASVEVDAGKDIALNAAQVRSVRVWIDGEPVIPPYDLQMVGDSAVVLNGHPLRVISRQPAPAAQQERAPVDRLVDSAYAAMRSAVALGLPDSVVTAAGCAVLNADTTFFGPVTVEPPWKVIIAAGPRMPDGTRSPGRLSPPTFRNLMARPDRNGRADLRTYYSAVGTSIARNYTYFLNRRGSDQTVSADHLSRLMADIRDAARAESTLTPLAWVRGGRMLEYNCARAIASKTRWED